MEGTLNTHLCEANSFLGQLDEMLVAGEKIRSFLSDDVNEISRIMHTIKESPAMMEFGSPSTIACHTEDLLSYIRNKGIESLNPEHKSALFNLMSRSEDYLREEISRVEGGTPLPDHAESLGREISGFLKEISGLPQDALPSFDQDPGMVAATGDTRDSIVPLSEDPNALLYPHIFLDDGADTGSLRTFVIVSSLEECEVDSYYYPGDMSNNPETCQEIMDNGFSLAFDSRGMASHAEELIKSQNHIRSYELANNLASAPGPEEAPKGQSLSLNISAPDSAPMAKAAPPAAPASQQVHIPVKQSLISANLMKLDSLMDTVGEIVITKSVVTSVLEPQLLPRDSFDSFMKSDRQLRKLTDDPQDIVISLHIVPISSVFQEMNRIVQDMNRKLNKDVHLTIIGEGMEVDKTIVGSIQGPVMHLVRNSMDHGIEETTQERADTGKKNQGEIILSASHTSSEIVTSVFDDGYGMSPGKLLAKAEERGLLAKPESEYSRREAPGPIMLPGFSTNQVVIEYSDRSVGMDVVKKNVESAGDTISVSSENGKGITVTTNIPLTLAIMDGVKMTVENSVFTIPISDICQSFKVDAGQIVLDEYGDEMIERMEHFYLIVRLHSFYDLETEIISIEDGILMWMEASDHSCCLSIDNLIGGQQIVVKLLSVFLNSFDLKGGGIAGCTILGDGNISIILGTAGLYAAIIENI